MEITESFVFALYNFVLAGFGSLILAAGGLAFRIIDLAFMPIFGVSHGLLPVVGYSLGARLWDRLWTAVRKASVALALVMAAATLVLEIIAPDVIGIFTKDPELIAFAVPAMRIILATLCIIGPSILFITTIQGLSKGKDALVLSLVRQLIFFVPALFLLPRFLEITGVWLSLPVSDILGFIVAGFWLLREYRLQQRSGVWLQASITEAESKS
jgi:Na+-driven multidrug efflux pump